MFLYKTGNTPEQAGGPKSCCSPCALLCSYRIWLNALHIMTKIRT